MNSLTIICRIVEHQPSVPYYLLRFFASFCSLKINQAYRIRDDI